MGLNRALGTCLSIPQMKNPSTRHVRESMTLTSMLYPLLLLQQSTFTNGAVIKDLRYVDITDSEYEICFARFLHTDEELMIDCTAPSDTHVEITPIQRLGSRKQLR